MQKTIEENKDLLKFNAEGVHPADMFLNARKVAIKAVDDYMIGKEEPMYCGFAMCLFILQKVNLFRL